MKFTKKSVYIGLFAVLYLIVAFSSFFHACAFFGLANNVWMSIILAFAFEVGQAAVLFSLLTSTKDRSRIMPWVLMTMFTLVQVIGNVYSSYKYIITNSVENLRYFKEPIFIWTELPDAQANVIIVYLVGALLPIAALLLTSMITNYLTDQSEEFDSIDQQKLENKIENKQEEQTFINNEGDSVLNQNSVLQMENQGLEEANKKKDDEIKELKKQLEDLKYSKIQQIPSIEIHEPIPFSEPEGLKNNTEEKIQETDLEEDVQINEEGIEGVEIEEDESNNIKSESLEKIIDEEQKPLEVIDDQTENEISEDQHMNEEESIIEKNDKETNTIENKQLKSSHFINL